MIWYDKTLLWSGLIFSIGMFAFNIFAFFAGLGMNLYMVALAFIILFLGGIYEQVYKYDAEK